MAGHQSSNKHTDARCLGTSQQRQSSIKKSETKCCGGGDAACRTNATEVSWGFNRPWRLDRREWSTTGSYSNRSCPLHDSLGWTWCIGPLKLGFNDQVGKTTLARIVANTTKSRFKELSATSSGVNDVKKVFDEAANELRLTGGKTIIFMDEIHRFTKAQQDVFLPFVEKGTITLYNLFLSVKLI